MKVMQINAVYPKGSTGNIVRSIHVHLVLKGHKSVVVFGRGRRALEKGVYKAAPELIMKIQSLRSKLTGFAYAGCYYSTRRILYLIKSENPDIVHLHCINAYMVNIFKLLTFLKVNKIPTIITLHAEFMYTAGCGHALACIKWREENGCHRCEQKGTGRPSSKLFDKSSNEWRLMRNAYCGFLGLSIVSVSPWLGDRAKQSPFFRNTKVLTILNGIDTRQTFQPKDITCIRTKYKLASEIILLHVTPNFQDPLKGGNHIINLAKKFIHENVKIIIVGFNGNPKMLPDNILPIMHTTDASELADFYSLADVTLLTSIRETFSLVCAESLSCGTPVVGYRAGAPETISMKEYSEFVEQGNLLALERAVRLWMNKKREGMGNMAEEARAKYSSHFMCQEYLSEYEAMLGEAR